MPISIPNSGIQYIRINRYDNNGEDIATTIKYAKSIRVNHGSRVRQYDIKSVILDPNANNVYYLEVTTNFTSQPGSGANKAVALVPAVEFDLEYNEYNALFSNANDNQQSRTRFVVNRDTMAGAPSNVLNIVNRREKLAEIQDDLYTDVGLANGRFEGSKNTSTDINVHLKSDKSINQMPAVELTQDYFAYFKYIGGTSPEIPNKVAADIKYFIGPSGSIVDTKSDPNAFYILKENFETLETVNVRLDDPKFGGQDMSSLNGNQTIVASGVYSAPITNNHYPAMPVSIASGSDRYTNYIIYQNKQTDTLIATDVGDNAFTASVPGPGTYDVYWITGSEQFTRSLNDVQVYGNNQYRQIGIGLPVNSVYFSDWVATGELEEGLDYLTNQTIEGQVMDILFTTATGYNAISDSLLIKEYDYITFHSTDFPNWRNSFQVLEVNYNNSNNEVYIRLNRSIEVEETVGSYEWTEVNRNKFSITRYKDSSTLLTLDTDKPPGGTSGGIIKPKYVSQEAEESIRKTISDLREKGMI